MKSYEINIICDTDDCDSIETSDPAGLADAEEQIQRNCNEDGWEIQGDSAVCPYCIYNADDQEQTDSEWLMPGEF